jgi:enoyl-[acyl-carrier protein] reductase I
VARPGELEAVFERVARDWGRLDILVHSIAWAPKEDLQGGLLESSAEASRRPWTSRVTRSSAWRGWPRRS